MSMNTLGNRKAHHAASKSAYSGMLNLLPSPSVNSSLQNKAASENATIGPFDVHVHMGQYFDDYYTPPRILRTLKLAGIPSLLVKQVPFHHLSIPFIS